MTDLQTAAKAAVANPGVPPGRMRGSLRSEGERRLCAAANSVYASIQKPLVCRQRCPKIPLTGGDAGKRSPVDGVVAPGPAQITEGGPCGGEPKLAFDRAANQACLSNVVALVDRKFPFVLQAVSIEIEECTSGEDRGRAVDHAPILADKIRGGAAEFPGAELPPPSQVIFFSGFSAGFGISNAAADTQESSSLQVRRPEALRDPPSSRRCAPARIERKALPEKSRTALSMSTTPVLAWSNWPRIKTGVSPSQIEREGSQQTHFILHKAGQGRIGAAVGDVARQVASGARHQIEIPAGTGEPVAIHIEAIGKKVTGGNVGSHLQGYAVRIGAVEILRLRAWRSGRDGAQHFLLRLVTPRNSIQSTKGNRLSFR